MPETYQRLDPYTVVDEFGQPHYMPADYSAAPTQGPLGDQSVTQAEPLAPEPVPQAPVGGPPVTELPVQPPAPTLVPPPSPEERATEAVGTAVTTGPAGFTAQGGQAKNRPQLGQVVMGAAAAQGRADVSRVQGEAAVGRATAEGEQRQAQFYLEAADKYDEMVNDGRKRAKERSDAFLKRQQDALSQETNPQRFWNNMSGLGKVMWILGLAATGWTKNPNDEALILKVMEASIDRDIESQRLDFERTKERLGVEERALAREDQGDESYLEKWFTGRNLRLKSIESGLKAKIAEVGSEAAERTGLLDMYARVQAAAAKVQADGVAHIEAKEAARALRAHQAWMAQKQHEYNLEEIRARAAAEREGQGPGPGVDPTLGVTVLVNGQPQRITAQGATPEQVGKNTQEIAKTAQSANLRYGNLLTVREELKKMTTTDLARGGTARFKAAITSTASEIARKRGGPITASDMQYALIQELGVPVSVGTDDQGFWSGSWELAKNVGDSKDSALGVIDANIRNLPKRTVDEIKALRGDLPGDVTYQPQDLREKEPGTTTTSEDIALSGAGAEVGDIQAQAGEQTRAPLGKRSYTQGYTPTRLAPGGTTPAQQNVGIASGSTREETARNLDEAMKRYREERKPGGSEPPPLRDQTEVDAVVSRMEGKGTAAIRANRDAAMRRSDLSPEAKMRVWVEADVRLGGETGRKGATAKERLVKLATDLGLYTEEEARTRAGVQK